MKPESTTQKLAQALADVHLECQSAEHDYRRTLQDGADHMASRYQPSHLESRPQDLDHWVWHQDALHAAIERAGISPVPPIPFQPTSGDDVPTR